MAAHGVIALLAAALLFPGRAVHPDSFSLSELEVALKNDPTNRQLILEVAWRYHNLLLAGTDEATWKKADRQMDLLEKQFKIKKATREGSAVDPLALALHASYRILRGGRTSARQSRLGKYYSETFFINEGIADLDRAVDLDSGNLKIGYIRAMNGYVSRRRNRIPISMKDFEQLVRVWERDPALDPGIDISLPGLYLVWGKCARLDEDFLLAQEIWSILKKKYPRTKEAEEAQELSDEVDRDAKKQRYILDKGLLNPDGSIKRKR
ncbi:MAG: hypothetical protein HYU36_10665 [Planctomycetes bacterium]|nr:hypothetical protein [Planctomycetota bacterium]